ncbi:MAG: thioredoxin [Clostridia bacterium]|nr:thioredoxin [Clostridia bacterium]
MVHEFTDENFEEEVLKSDKTVLVDVFATWCGPCKMMSPVIDQIAEELGDSVKVGKVDSDENPEIAEKYGIMSIPTIMVIKNGQVVKTFVGVTAKSEMLEALK